jgi:hypothetical protein
MNPARRLLDPDGIGPESDAIPAMPAEEPPAFSR